MPVYPYPASDHLKPACTRPGGGSYDESATPTGKGKGKAKGKSVAKAQVANPQSSAEQSSSGAASSGGTSGLEGVDIKAIREVQELSKSMKMARLRVSAEVDE